MMPKISEKHIQLIQSHLSALRIGLINQIDKGILKIQEEIIDDVEKDK